MMAIPSTPDGREAALRVLLADTRKLIAQADGFIAEAGSPSTLLSYVEWRNGLKADAARIEAEIKRAGTRAEEAA